MSKKVGITVLIVVILVIMYAACQAGVCSGINNKINNKVAGTYKEQYLEITLNNDDSFTYINRMSGLSAKGKYTYDIVNEDKAIVTLIVESGYCSYNGGVVYFNLYGKCIFSPTINGSEVVARAMEKVN